MPRLALVASDYGSEDDSQQSFEEEPELETNDFLGLNKSSEKQPLHTSRTDDAIQNSKYNSQKDQATQAQPSLLEIQTVKTDSNLDLAQKVDLFVNPSKEIKFIDINGSQMVDRASHYENMYKPKSYSQSKFKSSTKDSQLSNASASKHKNQMSYLVQVARNNSEYLNSKWNSSRKNRINYGSRYGFKDN
ncbi:MAG: hypothetical protein MHPSP_002004 [Paramarteilia canceri]